MDRCGARYAGGGGRGDGEPATVHLGVPFPTFMRHVALLCGLLLFSLVLPRGAFHCCSHGDAIAADAMDGPAVDQDGSCPICDLMPPPYHGMGPCGIAPRVAELGRVLVA